VTSVDWSSDDSFLVSGGLDSIVMVWDAVNFGASPVMTQR